MMVRTALSLFFLGFIGIALADDASNVLVLHEKNFDETIKANKYILVEFCKFSFTFTDLKM